MAPSGFLQAYETELARRAIEQRAREEREIASQAIDDHVTREIAMLMREQEAQSERQAQDERARAILGTNPIVDGELSDRARAAYVRALEQGNYSALAALDREIARQFEEEELAVMLLLTH
jgi:hypothetical protein